ncbi:unnamed protein product [Acanthoscelides obtectus]|uniref:Uncharacterized protein n=1 Tax=Acanthoscelides obtectus TaxID=200917 RepID=A0A9P0Q0E8_ACAOB|nr:unnamed protein product [Acanthoscelides obtectus]CAK1649464.1 hypothetical protein AOBTE_LOCUS16260 [Acanthoscelides obtectus]
MAICFDPRKLENIIHNVDQPLLPLRSASSAVHRPNCRVTPLVAPTPRVPTLVSDESPARFRPDGCQYLGSHGQGCAQEADREYEIPGGHGTLAALQVYRSCT